MLIVCPTCATTYKIQLAALGEAGRPVRCTKCKNTWTATPESAIEEAELIPAAAVNRAPAPPPPPKPPAPRPQTDEEMAAAWENEAAGGEVMPPEAPADGAETAPVIADSPPLVPQDPAEDAAEKFDPGAPEDDIETPAARRARLAALDRKKRRSMLKSIVSAPAIIVAMLVILAIVLQARVALVRTFPQTASLFSMIGLPVNLRGLIFEKVKSTGEFHDGVMVLVVEGTIVNLTGRTLEVPRLRFGLRNGSGHEVYAWTALPPASVLGSGDELPFRSRLASPPPDGRDVIVRFFNRRDIGTGSP